MKIFLALVWLSCFCFGAISGASLKTWREVRYQYETERILPARFIQMSLKELSEVKI